MGGFLNGGSCPAERGTYAGRILARVRARVRAGPTDLSTALLDHPTLIQPWPRQHDWCP